MDTDVALVFPIKELNISDDFADIEKLFTTAGFKKTHFSSTVSHVRGRNFKKDHALIRVERRKVLVRLGTCQRAKAVVKFSVKARTANGGTAKVKNCGWWVGTKKSYGAAGAKTLLGTAGCALEAALAVTYEEGTGLIPHDFVEPEFTDDSIRVEYRFPFVTKATVAAIAHLRDDGRFLINIKNPKSTNLWFIIYAATSDESTLYIAFNGNQYYFLKSAQLHKKSTWRVDNHPRSLKLKPICKQSISILKTAVSRFMEKEFSTSDT